MATTESSEFAGLVAEAYATSGAAVELGAGVLDGALLQGAGIRIPLATVNRHGLIAGATGTGKTRTLQMIAEQLSAAGVCVFAADVKGDLSGLAVPGSDDGAAKKRAADLGLPFTPAGFPVEYLSLGGIGPGVPVRATVSDFGPLLLAKILGANKTQEQALELVFHNADERALPLLDLSGLRALLTFLDSEGGREELQGIGGLSTQTVGVLLRALVGLETGGGTEFFGEPQLDIDDLLRVAPTVVGSSRASSCLPCRTSRRSSPPSSGGWSPSSSSSSRRWATATSLGSSSSSTRRTCSSTARARPSWSRSCRPFA